MSASDAQSMDTASPRSTSSSSESALLTPNRRSMSISSDRSAGTGTDVEDTTEETPLIQQPPANEPPRPPIVEPYQPHQRLEHFPLPIQSRRQGNSFTNDERSDTGDTDGADSDADTVFTSCTGNTEDTEITIPPLIGAVGQPNHNLPGNLPDNFPPESDCDRCERLWYDDNTDGPDGRPAYLSRSHACICASCPRRVHIHGHTIVSAGTIVAFVAGVPTFMCLASQCEQ